MTDEEMQEKTDLLRNVRKAMESASRHVYTASMELDAAERHFDALCHDLQKGWSDGKS